MTNPDLAALSIWIGFDRREAAAFSVARHSARRRTWPCPSVHGLELGDLQKRALYTRPIAELALPRGGRQLYDPISEAAMSTEFAISRFLTPILAKTGWALFMDADVLVRRSLMRLFELADPKYAVMCVKHPPLLTEGEKMDGQTQASYPRKNWSSVMLFNCEHPANERLDLHFVNTAPGRDLHAFSWLEDDQIGELPPEWNWLVGHSDLAIASPSIVHFTDGFPLMPGYEDQPFADEWRTELSIWATA
jgi:hypothetical protein